MKHLALASLLLASVVALSCGRGMTLAAVGYHLPEPPPLDQARFETYTLFFATSLDQNGDAAVLSTLQQDFDHFAEQIGARNAAVWVQEDGIPSLSVSKGQFFADRYRAAYGERLDYAQGPFVVVTDAHPNDWRSSDTMKAKGCIALSFRDRTTAGIEATLGCLLTCIHDSGAEGDVGARLSKCRCGLKIYPGTVALSNGAREH